jgi:hypothetical protein
MSDAQALVIFIGASIMLGLLIGWAVEDWFDNNLML